MRSTVVESGGGRATNVPYDILHEGTTSTVSANQSVNGGQWVLLGSYELSAFSNNAVTIRTTSTNGYVLADAVRFVLQ